MKKAKGQSLVEILIALAISGILVGAAATGVTVYLRSNYETKLNQNATFLAQGLMDNVRSWAEGDWHRIYDLSKTSANKYSLITSSSPYISSSSAETVTINNTAYTRYFYVDNVNRDLCGAGYVTSTAATSCNPDDVAVGDDPSTQRVTVVVTTPAPHAQTITLQEYMTRSKVSIFSQNDWSGGSGQESFATSSTSSPATVNNKFASSATTTFSAAGQIILTGLRSSGDLVWVATSNPSTSNFEQARGIYVDATSTYIVGYDDLGAGTNFEWRIEKRSITDGSLILATTTNLSSSNDAAMAVVGDTNYLYIAGYESVVSGNTEWRIQKRNKSDLSLAWSQSSGNLSNAQPEDAAAIAIDATSTYVYIGGSDALSGAADWRLEKRNASDGSLDSWPNGLVGYWPFNEGNGTLTNDLVSVNTGTLTNDPTWTTSSKIGGGLTFNGITALTGNAQNQYVNVASVAALNPSNISVAAWFKTSSNNANQTLVAKSTSCASAGYLVWINENAVAPHRVSWWVGNGPWVDEYATATAVDDGNWHHFVGTYDGTTRKIYVDGALQIASTSVGETLSSTGALQIGGSNYCGSTLNGSLDEVRIYNTVLSASDVTSLYNTSTSSNTWVMSIDTYATSGTLTALTYNSGYLYLAGYELVGASGNEQWRIEKRNATDGSLVWESSVNAGRSGSTSSEIAYGLSTDSTNVYVAGYEDLGDTKWKIEQRPKTGPVDDGITSNLVGRWNFSEGSGTIATSTTGSGNTGTFTTVTTGTPVWTSGQFDGGLRFNGTSSYVSVPGSSSIWPGSTFTISLWAKKLGSGDQEPRNILISKNGTYLDTCYQNKVLYSFMNDNNVQVLTQGGTCPALGEWVHYAATYQSGTLVQLYVNGNREAFTSAGIGIVSSTVTDALRIGMYNSPSATAKYDFNGVIDDVRIYSTVLSTTQLASIYAAGRGVSYTVTDNYTVGASDIPYAITIDGAYMYIGGSANGGLQWLTEKRNISDGSLVWAKSETLANTSAVYAITTDANFIYTAGSDAGFNPDEEWRIEQRLK